MRYFAVSDNRESKAKMIEAVLCDFLGVETVENKIILDLGCGSGHIAEKFSHANEVVAADVVDQITAPRKGSFQFKKIDSALLPFEDNSFDIVILNHVFYCTPDPLGQLKEIHRILNRNGVCYFASVNRYFPIEGFTNIPLIHYLPGRLFRYFYKIIRKTDDDLFPAGYHKIIRLMERAGFKYREYTSEIIHNATKYHSEHSIPFYFPLPRWFSPTVVFILIK